MPETKKDSSPLNCEYLKATFAQAVHNYFAPLRWVYKNLTGERCSLASCYDNSIK